MQFTYLNSRSFVNVCIVSCIMGALPTWTMAGSADFVEALETQLVDWEVQAIDVQVGGDGRVLAFVTLDDTQTLIELSPHSLRSANFTVTVVEEDGSMVDMLTVPPSRTYRGWVQGYDGSQVAASIDGGSVTARIDLGDGHTFFIEPAMTYDRHAQPSDHIVYRAEDTLPTDHRCATDELERPLPDQQAARVEALPNALDPAATVWPTRLVTNANGDKLAEIAFDTDFEFYQLNGSSVANTVADIENIMNGVDLIYQQDVDICYRITNIIVRSNSNDPYTSNNASTLLDQFQNHWNSQQGGVQRDIAHLMTGRNISGGTIGIAYLGVICNSSFGYGVSQSRFTSNYNNRVALTAHELGHNWNAPHCCGSCFGCNSCRIMCPCLGGCSGIVTSFGSGAISSILSHKNSRSCLDDGCSGPYCGDPLTSTTLSPGLAGLTNTISVRGADQGSDVEFFYSVQNGSSSVDGCPGLFLSLGSAKSAGVVTADADCDATLTTFVPEGATGKTVRIQAVDKNACEATDIVIQTFP